MKRFHPAKPGSVYREDKVLYKISLFDYQKRFGEILNANLTGCNAYLEISKSGKMSVYIGSKTGR